MWQVKYLFRDPISKGGKSMSMASLSRAASGLAVSQRGLEVTGHNLSNVNTPGYVRQQALQHESRYMTLGRNGNNTLSVGMGADVTEIRQIRDIFLDKAYRAEASKQSFYSARQSAVHEVENIFGEINGEGFSDVIKDFWLSINELAEHPDGLEARGMFVQSAVTFTNKANHIAEQLQSYQKNLNLKIKNHVTEINTLASDIAKMNKAVAIAEVSGDNANDYRDQRNIALDRLSQLIQIRYKEDASGQVNVQAEGYTLVSGQVVSKMEVKPLAQAGDPYNPFLIPVWAGTDQAVFSDRPIDPRANNDNGELKSILLIRGNRPANHTTDAKDVEPYLIPKIQREFDILVNSIVTMINEQLAPESRTGGPIGLDGSQYEELFSRKNVTRYDANGGFNEEDGTPASDPQKLATLYSAGNLMINPTVLRDYNKITLSASGDKNDITVIQKMLTNWQDQTTTYDAGVSPEQNYQDYFSEFTARIGMVGSTASRFAEDQKILVSQIDHERNRLSGVSLDEEMTGMMKYQHAYNASARVVSAIDTMIDTIVNRMGLVGR